MTRRILARAWPVLLTVVLGLAAAQALLILGQPPTAFEPGFVLRVLGSVVAIGLAGWLLTSAAISAADGARFGARSPRVALWAACVGVAASAAWVLSPFATPFVLLVGLWLMPASASSGTVRNGIATVRRHPWRAAGAALLTLMLSFVAWVVGLLCGFFVTGPLGTFLAWLVAGVLASAVIVIWTSLLRRATSTELQSEPA